jgi:RNA recognition motif-containing protein
MAAAPDASLLATKRIVYVGSLANEIKEELIRAAFIPFGSIKSVMMVSG